MSKRIPWKARPARIRTLQDNIRAWEKEHRERSLDAFEQAKKANRVQRNLEIAQWDLDSQLGMPGYGEWDERMSWKRDREFAVEEHKRMTEYHWRRHHYNYDEATNALAKIAAARAEIARLEYAPFRNLAEYFTWPLIIWKATRIIAAERAAAPTVDPVQQVIHRQMMKIATGEYIYFKNLPSPYQDK